MALRSILRALGGLAAALVLSTTAQAQLFRAYLAIGGNDANPCTLPQPCRLLPAALAAVADGGEIWMLDSANYNTATVTIGKSVSILAVPGAVGSVVATGGPAILISASGLKVALRNLVIVPLPAASATHGVHMTGASALTIEDSLIANLPVLGVYVSGAGTLRIAGSVLRGNASYAAWLENGARGEISRTRMTDNTNGGVIAWNNVASRVTTVVVSDCVIADKGGGVATGVSAVNQATGSEARMTVTRTVLEGLFAAAHAETGDLGTATTTLNAVTIAHNNYAWYRFGTGSLMRTMGNNQFTDNTTTLGALTPVALQ